MVAVGVPGTTEGRRPRPPHRALPRLCLLYFGTRVCARARARTCAYLHASPAVRARSISLRRERENTHSVTFRDVRVHDDGYREDDRFPTRLCLELRGGDGLSRLTSREITLDRVGLTARTRLTTAPGGRDLREKHKSQSQL